MNISGIPWLQTAAGCSIGEVVDPAKGHQSRTLQEASLSSHWPTAEPNWNSAGDMEHTLKQEFRILADGDVV